MSVALLDVNVLVALFDPSHPHHDEAHQWFALQRRRGWATCAITINGCVRVLGNPAYPSVEATPADVLRHLRILCDSAAHQFWSEAVSLVEDRLFRPEMIVGHRQITDVYLLGMCVRRGGRLATFDRSIPIKPVIGATEAHMEVIGQEVR